MNTYWKIDTHGDPIGAVQVFVQAVWAQTGLDGLLTSTNGGYEPHLLDNPEAVAHVNPFRPLMTENLAQSAPGMLHDSPERRLGVMLRPCEMRALIEISKRQPIPRERLVTICLDCLGTYPTEEYEWRVGRKGSPENLANDALKFARQGGILAYRYRTACQICADPGAHSADLNIHVLGLPVRQEILIQASNPENGESPKLVSVIDLAALTNGPASAELIQQHQNVLAKQAERHHQTMERVMQVLEDLLPRNVEEMAVQLESCGDCQKCMSVCPICSVDFPSKNSSGHYDRQSIRRWLVSCAGCGMCEQACISNLPLGVIFGSIREKLDEELNYTPGRLWTEALPL